MADQLGVRQRFQEILEASRTQDRSKQATTLVVLSHLQQMTLLMIKKGLAFYCDQDTYKSRSRFLDGLISLNKIDIRFPSIIRNFLPKYLISDLNLHLFLKMRLNHLHPLAYMILT